MKPPNHGLRHRVVGSTGRAFEGRLISDGFINETWTGLAIVIDNIPPVVNRLRYLTTDDRVEVLR